MQTQSFPPVTSRRSSKLFIPHLDEPDCNIAGVLEQLEPEASTHGRNIALILHGFMSHKDYLFLKGLAHRLPMDSFRFDFRGNGESGGTWKFDGVPDDVADIHAVVFYLTRELGYVVNLLIAYSRASIAATLWLCEAEEAKYVSGFVNVSGRYRLKYIYNKYSGVLTDENRALLERQGYFEFKGLVARKPFVGRVTAEDMARFVSTDLTCIWDCFPAHIDVLSMHGLSDPLVPVYDSVILHQAFAARSPGTAVLHLAEGGDHLWTKRSEEVITTVLKWWDKRERKDIRTGLWDLGMRGKL